MIITINRRECDLGGNHKGTTKEKDGQVTKLLTFELAEVELDERELNSFLREPHAWRSLYNDGPNGIEPFLKCFKAMELEDSIEGAYVALFYGLGEREMTFTECKLSKIKLALCAGGRTKLSCKVTTAPTLDDTLPELFEQFGNRIECELRAEPPGAQQDLPLNKHGAAEEVLSFPGRDGKKKRGRPRKNSGAHPH